MKCANCGQEIHEGQPYSHVRLRPMTMDESMAYSAAHAHAMLAGGPLPEHPTQAASHAACIPKRWQRAVPDPEP